MQIIELIENRVQHYYWDEDINCATTIIKTLAELFEIKLNNQLIDASVGMHGAGGYRAQCGLVEGTLMFLGILGREKGLDDEKIISVCYQFAEVFEKEFKSLNCSILRPEGFKPDNPPHLCEKLTVKAVHFAFKYISDVYRDE